MQSTSYHEAEDWVKSKDKKKTHEDFDRDWINL